MHDQVLGVRLRSAPRSEGACAREMLVQGRGPGGAEARKDVILETRDAVFVREAEDTGEGRKVLDGDLGSIDSADRGAGRREGPGE